MQPGLLWAVGAAILWGVEPVLVDEAMDELPSIPLNAWRNLGAVLFSLPIALISSRVLPDRRSLALIAASGAISQGIGMVTYSEAIHRSGPGKAVPIVQTFVFWAQLLGFTLFGEEITKVTLLGVLLAMAGVWLVAGGGGRADPTGLAAAFLTSILWASGDALARAALFNISPISANAWRSLMMFLSFTALSSSSRHRIHVSRKSTALAGFSGFIGLGVALFLYYRAMWEVAR
ncbi:MAG TPA: EamA family transporter [Candidatus Korarchaeota archaeon]|nr:EamA family transporter [Candidatus Korarchaeota archaeon]